MADRIHANTEWLDKCARDLSSIERSISGVAGQLAGIKLRKDEGGNLKVSLSCGLRMTGTGFSGSNASDDIRQLQRAAAALSSATAAFSSGASRAARLLESAENTAISTMRGLSSSKASNVYENSDGQQHGTGKGGSEEEKGKPEYEVQLSHGARKPVVPSTPLTFLGIPIGVEGSVVSGKIEGKTKIGNIDAKGSAEGELLGGSINKKGTLKWEYKTEKGKVSSGLEAGVEAKGHLAEGKVNGNLGILHGEATGKAGTATGTGSVGLTLVKDGVFSPSAQGKIQGKITGLDGSAEIRMGSENFNKHVKADGSLGVLKGEISAGAGRITYTDAEGKQHTEIGIQGKIGGEAYAAEGKVSGGFSIMGIKIDLGVSGKAGGGGISAGGQFTSGGLSGKVDAGLGLGAGVEVNVDWSKFNPLSVFELDRVNKKTGGGGGW